MTAGVFMQYNLAAERRRSMSGHFFLSFYISGWVNLVKWQGWMERRGDWAAAGWWGGGWDPPLCMSVAGQGPALLGMGTGEDKYWLLACLWWFASLLPGWLTVTKTVFSLSSVSAWLPCNLDEDTLTALIKWHIMNYKIHTHIHIHIHVCIYLFYNRPYLRPVSANRADLWLILAGTSLTNSLKNRMRYVLIWHLMGRGNCCTSVVTL